MKLYLYRNMGDWCLEDPTVKHGLTTMCNSLRYRLRDGEWSPEERIGTRWLDADGVGALLATIGDDRDETRVRKKVGRFLQSRLSA